MHPHRVAMTTSSSKFGKFDCLSIYNRTIRYCGVFHLSFFRKVCDECASSTFFSTFFQMTIKASSLHDLMFPVSVFVLGVRPYSPEMPQDLFFYSCTFVHCFNINSTISVKKNDPKKKECRIFSSFYMSRALRFHISTTNYRWPENKFCNDHKKMW